MDASKDQESNPFLALFKPAKREGTVTPEKMAKVVHKKELSNGWVKTIVKRRSSSRVDPCLHSPAGHKIRSNVELLDYLKANPELQEGFDPLEIHMESSTEYPLKNPNAGTRRVIELLKSNNRKRKRENDDNLKILGYDATPKRMLEKRRSPETISPVRVYKSASLDDYKLLTPKRVQIISRSSSTLEETEVEQTSLADISVSQALEEEKILETREALDLANTKIKQMMTINDHFFGIDSIVQRAFFRKPVPQHMAEMEAMEEMPVDCRIALTTFTSEDDNSGVSQKELDGLWLDIVSYLNGYLSSNTYPNAEILHHVAHMGLKEHQSPQVRSACYTFLYQTMKEIFPPTDISRDMYLKLFSQKLKKKVDLDQCWNNLNFHINRLVLEPKEATPGDESYFEFLVALMEEDVFRWMDWYEIIFTFKHVL